MTRICTTGPAKHLVCRLRCSARRFQRDESGAAYSLSVVLIMPIYIAFVVLAMELALLANSRQALTAAMQTASHATSGWLLHRDALTNEGHDWEKVIHGCVARNMVAFATTNPDPAAAGDSAFIGSLERAGMSALASQRYGRKLNYVSNALRIRLDSAERDTRGYLVQAEYDSPLWFPAVTRFLATGQNQSQAVCTLTARVWLPVADSEMDTTNLGIPYSPVRATQWR